MGTDTTTKYTHKSFDEAIEEYVSIHGIKSHNKRETPSIFSSQLRIPSNRISIKKSFFGGGKK